MQQETLNEIMRPPGEVLRAPAPQAARCPLCGEPYCGNGSDPCTECAAEIKRAQAQDLWHEEMRRDAFGDAR